MPSGAYAHTQVLLSSLITCTCKLNIATEQAFRYPEANNTNRIVGYCLFSIKKQTNLIVCEYKQMPIIQLGY